MLYHQQGEVRQAWRQGKLKSLGAVKGTELRGASQPHRALIVTQGRVPQEDWRRLTGLSYLPVLLSSSPMARLLVREIHEEDHRKDVGWVLAASRRKAWIVRGRQLIKSVVKSCTRCRLENKKVQANINRLEEQVESGPT